MSEQVSSVMEKFSSCKKEVVSLIPIALFAEPTQLGRDRRSYVGVSSPEKDPNEVKKSSNSALNAVRDDGNAAVESVDVR